MLAALLGLSALLLAAGPADAPTADEADLPLTGLMTRADSLVAANAAGLFRADRQDRRWLRLPTPADMPAGGTFGRAPEGSKTILYVSSRAGMASEKDDAAHGLYLSRDDGATWRRIDDRPDLGSVWLRDDGTLYAVTNPGAINAPSRIHLSRDLGKTWRDITGQGSGQILTLLDDPDHPGLICLYVIGMRGYIAQAADRSYQWKPERERTWYERHPSVARFFHGTYSVNAGALYMLWASLSNAFEYDFGQSVQIPALEIRPRATRFEFGPGDPRIVPVEIVFRENLPAYLARWRLERAKGNRYDRPKPHSVTLIDQADRADLWILRVEHDGKHTFGQSAQREELGRAVNDREAVIARLRATGDFRPFWLDAGSAHPRTIDLATLADFHEPGEYRVQLIYDSMRIADHEAGQWSGMFNSPVFRVVIRGEP